MPERINNSMIVQYVAAMNKLDELVLINEFFNRGLDIHGVMA